MALRRVALWGSGAAPLATEPNEDAFITIYPACVSAGNLFQDRVVLICPGGGYSVLWTLEDGQLEGASTAQWFAQTQGTAAAILEYRLPRGRSSVPLSDAQRAIEFLRTLPRSAFSDHDDGHGVCSVGILGFSAGGHLASSAATLFTNKQNRPDFAVLIYPVIALDNNFASTNSSDPSRGLTHSGSQLQLLGPEPSQALLDQYSTHKRVTPTTPPCFLAHAVDDWKVPCGNSEVFAAACESAAVSVQYVPLPSGGHGLKSTEGVALGAVCWGKCLNELSVWMKTHSGPNEADKERQPEKVAGVCTVNAKTSTDGRL